MAYKRPSLFSIILALLLVSGLVAFIWYFAPEKVEQEAMGEFTFEDTVTDFFEVGTATTDNPETGLGTPLLVYEKPGMPALTRDLVFDVLSFCASPSGAVPCVAMSATFDVSFGGKRVSVEGIETSEGVLVRKIRALREGEEMLGSETGNSFISWGHARSLIENCEAKMVFQTHALDVYLTLEDDRRVKTVEPGIDEVFRVLEGVQGKCPQIPVATE